MRDKSFELSYTLKLCHVTWPVTAEHNLAEMAFLNIALTSGSMLINST